MKSGGDVSGVMKQGDSELQSVISLHLNPFKMLFKDVRGASWRCQEDQEVRTV